MADTATKQTDPPSYEVIAAAVLGNPDTVNLVIRHYSGYIASLAARKGYGEDGVLRSYVDDELRKRLETKLIVAILSFNLN